MLAYFFNKINDQMWYKNKQCHIFQTERVVFFICEYIYHTWSQIKGQDCVYTKKKKTKQIIDRGVGPHRQKSVPLILHTCSHGTVRYMCTGSCDSSHSLTSLIHTIIMKGRERSRKAWTPASSLYINGYCWPGETDLVCHACERQRFNAHW